MKRDCIQNILLNSLLQEVNDEYTPNDGRLEKTIEKIESLLIGQKIGLAVNLFIIALCFSTMISILKRSLVFCFYKQNFTFHFLLYVCLLSCAVFGSRLLCAFHWGSIICFPSQCFYTRDNVNCSFFLAIFEIFFSKKVLAYTNLTLLLSGFVFGLFVEFLNSSSSIFISAIVFGAAF